MSWHFTTNRSLAGTGFFCPPLEWEDGFWELRNMAARHATGGRKRGGRRLTSSDSSELLDDDEDVQDADDVESLSPRSERDSSSGGPGKSFWSRPKPSNWFIAFLLAVRKV